MKVVKPNIAKHEVEQGQELMLDIIEDIPEIVFIIDREWRFTYVNRQAEAFLDKKRTELLGKDLWEILPPSTNAKYYQYSHQALADQITLEYEEFYPGLNRWFLVRIYPSKKGISACWQDISDRKKTETDLKRNKQRFELIGKVTNDVIWDWDLLTDIVWWNEGIKTILGYEKQQVEPNISWWYLHIHPDDLQRVTCKINGLINNGESSWLDTYRYQRANGDYINVSNRAYVMRDEKGKPIRIIGGMTEISDRQQSENDRTQLISQIEIEQAKLEAVIESMPDAVYIGNETGIWKCNQIAATMLGLESTKDFPENITLIGEKLQTRYLDTKERIPPEDAIFTHALRGHSGGRETIIKQVNSGRDIIVRCAAAPIKSNGKIIGAIAITTDITDRVQAEKVLQESNRQITNILKSITDAFYTLDRQWRFTYVNRQAEQILQKPHSELLGKNIWEVFPNTVGSNLYQEYYQAIATGVPAHFEEFYPQLNLWAEVHAYPSEEGISIYIRDISDRLQAVEEINILNDYLEHKVIERTVKLQAVNYRLQTEIRHHQQTEAALQEIQERLYLALEGAKLGMWDYDLISGKISWSERGKAIFGLVLDKSDLTYEIFENCLHPEDRQQVNQALAEAIANKIDYNTEYRIVLQNGDIRWVAAMGRALYNDTNQPYRMVGVLSDISDRKQTEEALRHQAEELEKVNRIKDEFLAVVSHELRTPLNSMLGWAQMLREQKLNPATTTKALEAIERNARSQAKLIDDILDVSRIIRGNLRLETRIVKMIPIIKAAIETVSPLAKAKGIQIESKLDASVDRMMGDSDRLQQVVCNLLSNAIKFTPSGGRVEIVLEPCGDRVQIAVIDTGKGIGADFLPYVFERFRQADGSSTRTDSGLGLGLAIVRQIVELHGGSVRVASDGDGKGSTFTVQLPALEGKRKVETVTFSDSRSDNQSQSQLINGLRVLVVDDDIDTGTLVSFILEQNGAQAIVVKSASEAIEAIAQFQPDILISDIAMPHEDGYSLIRKIRNFDSKDGKSLPAIAVTAFARDEDCQRAISAGFNKHISKPIEATELVNSIATLTGKK